MTAVFVPTKCPNSVVFYKHSNPYGVHWRIPSGRADTLRAGRAQSYTVQLGGAALPKSADRMPITLAKPASAEADRILDHLRSLGNPHNVQGMARAGITPGSAFGVRIPQLRMLAKQTGKNHQLARQLWSSGIHEARILATMVDEPTQVTDAQMEKWVKSFDSWDVCDQCCGNLFDKTPFAHRKALEWSGRPQEFVKRAGFVLMATLAVHDKSASDDAFIRFMPAILRECRDDRNFVKKAINWSLRQIGKRNVRLNKVAISVAEQVQRIGSPAATWIAADALRELTDKRVIARIHDAKR